MRIRVTHQAFWGNALRERGVVLDWPDGEQVPRWAVAVDAPSAVAPAVETGPKGPLPRNDGETWSGGRKVASAPPAPPADLPADAEPL